MSKQQLLELLQKKYPKEFHFSMKEEWIVFKRSDGEYDMKTEHSVWIGNKWSPIFSSFEELVVWVQVE